MNISITSKALQELKHMGVGGPQFMRISVVSGGCSGMTYAASIDTVRSEMDELVYENGDLRVISDKGSALYLDGLEIDYSDDLIRSGFRLANPRASHTCGCGASFSV